MDNEYFCMYLLVDFSNFEKKITVQNHCGKKFNEKSTLNLENLPHRLKEFHSLSNGFGITWQAKNVEELFGGFNFIPIEEIYENYINQLYFEDDLKDNPLLDVFRPFDEISPEVRCGFIDDPTEKINAIYLHSMSNDYGVQNLEIDFDGYVELMKMCWAYNNWPFILLYLQEDDIDESNRWNKELVENFKRDMPKVFPDFSWDDFVKKYKSLRL